MIPAKGRLHLITALITCIGLMAITSCSDKSAQSLAEERAPFSASYHVKTAPVERKPIDDVILVTGVIQSDAEARPSFKTGGVIAHLYAKEGDFVRKGQLLGKLNMTEIEAQTAQAQNAYDKAMRDLQRIENLYRDSIATLEQFQNTTTAADIAKKTLDIARFNTAWSEIRSPIDGRIIGQLLNEGEVTGPGVPVYYIIGVTEKDWKVVAGLTDKSWGRVKVGDAVRITLDAYPDWVVQGKVIRLADVANPMSGTFDVDVSISGKDKRLAAGMLARLEITPSSSQPFPIIPIEALVSSNGRTGVVYVPENGKAAKRVVQIHTFYGETVSIYSGLEGVEEVITAGSGFLEEGDHIILK